MHYIAANRIIIVQVISDETTMESTAVKRMSTGHVSEVCAAAPCKCEKHLFKKHALVTHQSPISEVIYKLNVLQFLLLLFFADKVFLCNTISRLVSPRLCNKGLSRILNCDEGNGRLTSHHLLGLLIPISGRGYGYGVGYGDVKDNGSPF